MTEARRTISWIRLARYAILLGALGIALILLVGPTWVVPIHEPSGLPFHQLQDHPEYGHDYVSARSPQYTLAVFMVCMSLWVTNLVPLASTGLLAVALLPVFGIVEPKQAFAYFGNSAVFFIIGVFMLAAAMIRTGLSKRCTLMLLQRFDRRPRLLLVGVICSASFLALWMPEHAVAAMMFPIVLEITDSLGLERGRSGYAKSLFLGLACGAVIGGCGTFLGGARAVLAVELMYDTFRDAAGRPIYSVSFLQWMKVTVPLVVVMTGVAVVVLTRFIRSEVSDIAPATRMLNLRVSELGPMSGRERRLAAVMLVTIVCWIVLGSRVNIAVIAVLSAVTLSVFRIVNWQEIQEYVNWGVVVMYGGAVAVGAALKDTHAMLWLVQQVLPSGGASPLLLLILMAALAIGLSAVISNAAAVAVLLPVGFALCGACQPAVHPMAMTYTVAIASGMAFVLPISSPPHAICFASGYYSMKEVPKYGIPITFLALLGMIGLITLYWPLIGTSITVQ